MDKQKELAEKIKKINELKKQIEKKEKKLQKVNSVLKAKEHVKQKLKEVNEPIGQKQNRVESSQVVINTDKQQKSAREYIKDSSNSTDKFNDKKSIDVDLCKNVQDITTTSNINNHDPDKDSVNTLTESENAYILVPKLGGDNAIQGTTDNKESKEKGNRGDSDDLPIIIADSQYQASNSPLLSSEDSENTKLATKRRLSLKRKKKHSCLLTLNKKQKSKDGLKPENNLGREISSTNAVEIIGIKNNDKENGSDIFTDSDSVSLLQEQPLKVALQLNSSIGLQVDSNLSQEIEHEKKGEQVGNLMFTTCCCINDCFCKMKKANEKEAWFVENSGISQESTSQESVIENTQCLPPRKRGRPPKRKKGHLTYMSRQIMIEGDCNNLRKESFKELTNTIVFESISQEIVIECTPNIDMNQAFVHSEIFKEIEKDSETKDSASNEIGNTDINMTSSPQDLLFEESTQENSQIKRRGLLELVHTHENVDTCISMSSQSSSASITLATEDSAKRRKRGRPPKNKVSIQNQYKNESKVETVTSLNLQNLNGKEIEKDTLCESLHVADKIISQEVFELSSQEAEELIIPESQELLTKHDSQELLEKPLNMLNNKHISESCEPKIDRNTAGLKGKIHNFNEWDSCPEISTLKLIQESYFEKKEYSTRRSSSLGSPFMISSIFQFIIDETKRKKETEDFYLPVKMFGKLMSRVENGSCHEDTQTEKETINISSALNTFTCNDHVVNDEIKQLELSDEFSKTEHVNIVDHMTESLTLNSKVQDKDIKMEKDESNDKMKFGEDKIRISEEKKLLVAKYATQTETWKEEVGDIFENGTKSDLLASQSLYTPNAKEDNKLKMSGEILDKEANYNNSQTDSVDSLLEDITGQNMSSLELQENEVMVDICSGTLLYRKRNVPVIGCLSTSSLALWKYYNGFTFLHKWQFPVNHIAEKICSFSLDGKAFFIVLVKTEDNQYDVYLTFYCNKRDNFIFKVTNLKTDSIETCHVNNRVIALGYNEGEMIHVMKYVLHNKWKSLATSDKLESTLGCLQSVHAIENLPAAICVWTKSGQFCLWNHENKRLLLTIKLDCLQCVPRLVGTVWEQGYFFLQLFNDSADSDAGVLLILNPSTMKSCVSSRYQFTVWKGLKRHHTTDHMIITLDDDNNICVWDRYTAELISTSHQKHATCVTLVDGHIVTGGNHCIHVH